MKKEKISIVVPCYNEEESLPIFYREINKISKEMKYVNFELLFINDGSSDNTLSILKKISKTDKKVRFISFSRNFGKEAGMWAGLENATGDYVAFMDVDMQDPPEKLKEMYEILISEREYDCVGLYTIDHKDYPFFRKFFTKVWYKLIARISGNSQIPGVRDFRLMRRKMVNSVLEMKEYNRYTKGILSFVGFNTKWLEFTAADRVAGVSKFNFWKCFKYAVEGIVFFSTTPLVISAILGIVLCFLSFGAVLFIVIKTLVLGNSVVGWPSLACIIIFFSGLQLFFLGIIGVYLSRIYLEVKKRPIYIISETENDMKK